MEKLFTLIISLFFGFSMHAQWAGDGYFLDGGNEWGTYETEVERSNFGGVYYRIKHSSGSVINVNPIQILPDGRLYLRWKQYRTFQNQWYPEFSGEMIVRETLVGITTISNNFWKTTSPSGILLAGAYQGEIRTLLKYISGVPYPSETRWAAIAWTINSGAGTTTAINPFDGLLEGYVLSTKGNIHGDFVLYTEPAVGGWGCMNGQYLHYYRSGGYYTTIICPTEYDLNTAEVIGYFNRYRTNASNLDRSKGIWRVGEWVQDLAGDIRIFRTPSRCPDNSPTVTPAGVPITGCLHAKMKINYKYSGGTPIEARESWQPYVFTLTANSTTAPTTVSSDPCDQFCDNYCRQLGKRSGRYNGSMGCALGTPYYPSKGCSCEN